MATGSRGVHYIKTPSAVSWWPALWAAPRGRTHSGHRALAKKPNYDFEKRKKEQDRKRKKDAKREERLQRKRDGLPDIPEDEETPADASE